MTCRPTLVIALLAVLTIAANASAQNGPYYAPPAWDQTLPCTTTSDCPRFFVLSNMSNAAVLDRETGLVWERSPTTTEMNWYDAERHCHELTTGGRLGWRLPTIEELISLVDPSVPFPGPLLPAGHPFTDIQINGFTYISATSSLNPAIVHCQAGPCAWDVTFTPNVRLVFDNHLKSDLDGVWCTRGSRGVDIQ